MEQAQVKTMSLPVKLTEAEVSLRAQELASAERELGEAEDALEDVLKRSKADKEQATSTIAEKRADVRTLGRIVRDRAEHRQVQVVEEPDYTAAAVVTIRVDTGEVVATRGMTQEERQRSLFLAKAGGQES